MEFLNSAVSFLNDILWSYVLIVVLVGAGIWFTIRTGVAQIRCIGEMFRLIGEGVSCPPREGHISTFQAFCVSSASRVGVGNIAGIAIAVTVGGPGAVFWMWIIAILGASTGFVESTLGQIYKVPKAGGGFLGGPAYYIRNVLGSPFFAGLFAVLISITYGLVFNSVQANTIASSLQASYQVPTWVMAVIVGCLTGAVIFGGLNRIAKVAGFMVPFMAGAYLLIALIVTLMNISMVPDVIALIIKSAFGFDAVMGAGIGAALMTGIKRGLFSNEAGMGAIPNAAATADATHPVKQGLVQAVGVYVDTLFVCTASAMIILVSPDWQTVGLKGVALCQHALAGQLGSWTGIFMSVMVLFFAFSSIVGNYFYGEINMHFISKKPIALQIFRGLVVFMVCFGSIASLDLVWNLADLFMAMMALTNLVAILILGKYAIIALDDYLKQKKAGVKSPEFDPSILPSQKGVYCWPRNKDDELKQA